LEHPITIVSDDFEIEALLDNFPGSRGVVVTHPHPLYGGDMRNGVVAAACRAYAETGFSTLRFNFRGVGKSGGRYGDGVGEQKDVEAAVLLLRDSGIDTVHLCGYSFGAWVNAQAVSEGLSVDAMIMVAPPVAFMDFERVFGLASLRFVLVGDRDEIAPLDGIRRMLPSWSPGARLETIPGADHFFSGKLPTLEASLRKYLKVPSPNSSV